MLPGFQDGHNHLIWSATQAEDIDMAGVTDAPVCARRSSRSWRRCPMAPGCVPASGTSRVHRCDRSAAVLDAITGDDRPISNPPTAIRPG